MRNNMKGQYLLGRCNDFNEASRRKQILIDEYGMTAKNIHIHPADMKRANIEDNAEDYGVEILGSFHGTPEFIQTRLQNKADEIQQVANQLILNTSSQSRMVLFKWCFNSKVNHLMRTMDPVSLARFLSVYGTAQRKIVSSLLKTDDINEEDFFLGENAS